MLTERPFRRVGFALKKLHHLDFLRDPTSTQCVFYKPPYGALREVVVRERQVSVVAEDLVGRRSTRKRVVVCSVG